MAGPSLREGAGTATRDRWVPMDEATSIQATLYFVKRNVRDDEAAALVLQLEAAEPTFDALRVILDGVNSLVAQEILRELEGDLISFLARQVRDGVTYEVVALIDLEGWDVEADRKTCFFQGAHLVRVRRLPDPCEDILNPWFMEDIAGKSIGAPCIGFYRAALRGLAQVRQV